MLLGSHILQENASFWNEILLPRTALYYSYSLEDLKNQDLRGIALYFAFLFHSGVEKVEKKLPSYLDANATSFEREKLEESGSKNQFKYANTTQQSEGNHHFDTSSISNPNAHINEALETGMFYKYFDKEP
jgi:hypothetical protein